MSHPVRGGLYQVRTILLSGTDPKPTRPVVVLALPPVGLPDVPVLARTSDTSERGVQHPKNFALGLTKDGVFGFRFQRSIDVKHFANPDAVSYLGMLEEQYFGHIVTWWENS